MVGSGAPKHGVSAGLRVSWMAAGASSSSRGPRPHGAVLAEGSPELERGRGARRVCAPRLTAAFASSRTGRMGAGEKKSACSVQYRRPFGCAVLSIADLLAGDAKDDLVLKVYM